MKKLILSLSIFTTLLSCKKENIVYYKYAYIDSRAPKVVTTHLIDEKKILSNEEINARLNNYRIKKDKYVLRDTILLMDESANFLINK